MLPAIALVLVTISAPPPARLRIAEDRAAGRPLVAHLHVALADQEHQGIAPVKGQLGDGMRPGVNLYWGALYGVRKFLPRNGWRVESVTEHPQDGVLERVVMSRRIEGVKAYVVADAWAGPRIGDAIGAFVRHASGRDVQVVRAGERELAAGGAAHVVAFLGHNGLMELPAPRAEVREERALANASIVLACLSKADFLPLIEAVGSEPLLLTESLMAPEAYTVDAALVAWFGGASRDDVYRRASDAYCAYQKCSRRTARSMFWGPTKAPRH